MGIFSGIQRAADTHDDPQGAKGYGERFGANTADGFTDVMIRGAILPSLRRQDPATFTKGRAPPSPASSMRRDSLLSVRGTTGSCSRTTPACWAICLRRPSRMLTILRRIAALGGISQASASTRPRARSAACSRSSCCPNSPTRKAHSFGSGWRNVVSTCGVRTSGPRSCVTRPESSAAGLVQESGGLGIYPTLAPETTPEWGTRSRT